MENDMSTGFRNFFEKTLFLFLGIEKAPAVKQMLISVWVICRVSRGCCLYPQQAFLPQ